MPGPTFRRYTRWTRRFAGDENRLRQTVEGLSRGAFAAGRTVAGIPLAQSDPETSDRFLIHITGAPVTGPIYETWEQVQDNGDGTFSVPGDGLTGSADLPAYEANDATVATGTVCEAWVSSEDPPAILFVSPSAGGLTSPLTADLDAGGHKITNLGNPTSAADAAPKGYVDTVATGLTPKPAATVATTAPLPAYTYSNGSSGVGATITFTATGAVSIDGHALALNDLVYVKDEPGGNAPYNGLFAVSTAPAVGVAGVLTRPTSMDAGSEFPGAMIFVEQGSVNAGSQWVVTNPVPPTVGTTAITSTQFAGPGTYSGTNGVSLSGTSFSLDTTHANSWSGAQTFADGALQLAGATSGITTLHAPATGGGSVTYPPGTGTLVLDTVTALPSLILIAGNMPGVQVVALGATLSPTGVWEQYRITIPFASVQVAAPTKTVTLVVLPAASRADQFEVYHDQFTGTGLTSLTAQLQNASGPTTIGASRAVHVAANDPRTATQSLQGNQLTTATLQVFFSGVFTGGNTLAGLTAGNLYVVLRAALT